MPTLLTDLLLFFCLGCMGHWTGDRDCEPTQLTVVTRMGAFLSLAYRAQKPTPVAPRRGFAMTEPITPGDVLQEPTNCSPRNRVRGRASRGGLGSLGPSARSWSSL